MKALILGQRFLHSPAMPSRLTRMRMMTIRAKRTIRICPYSLSSSERISMNIAPMIGPEKVLNPPVITMIIRMAISLKSTDTGLRRPM